MEPSGPVATRPPLGTPPGLQHRPPPPLDVRPPPPAIAAQPQAKVDSPATSVLPQAKAAPGGAPQQAKATPPAAVVQAKVALLQRQSTAHPTTSLSHQQNVTPAQKHQGHVGSPPRQPHLPQSTVTQIGVKTEPPSHVSSPVLPPHVQPPQPVLPTHVAPPQVTSPICQGQHPPVLDERQRQQLQQVAHQQQIEQQQIIQRALQARLTQVQLHEQQLKHVAGATPSVNGAAASKRPPLVTQLPILPVMDDEEEATDGDPFPQPIFRCTIGACASLREPVAFSFVSQLCAHWRAVHKPQEVPDDIILRVGAKRCPHCGLPFKTKVHMLSQCLAVRAAQVGPINEEEVRRLRVQVQLLSDRLIVAGAVKAEWVQRAFKAEDEAKKYRAGIVQREPYVRAAQTARDELQKMHAKMKAAEAEAADWKQRALRAEKGSRPPVTLLRKRTRPEASSTETDSAMKGPPTQKLKTGAYEELPTGSKSGSDVENSCEKRGDVANEEPGKQVGEEHPNDAEGNLTKEAGEPKANNEEDEQKTGEPAASEPQVKENAKEVTTGKS
eukprot:TRINITY_DN5501_c0_g1_i2.p1 TRINITY_DN5501_c0_g1~~TRINITY_DN5501_c0_g1_i2.p1  ORF type:complete len:554 (+),score=135.46 TRINITY_DN5501_c0_g1_i2:1257-2918(+)